MANSFIEPVSRSFLRLVVLSICMTSAMSHASSRDGATVYSEVCAACHDAGTARTPARDVLAGLSPERIVTSLETGSMRVIGNFSLSGPERVAVAEHLTGKTYNKDWADTGTNQCSPATWPVGDPLAGPHWNGWGNGLENARYQRADVAGMSAKDVPSLRLKWAFAFPGETFVESQPSIVGGRIFLGSPSGLVYALDAKTGCTHWTYAAAAPVKAAVTIAPLRDGSYGVFFGDQAGRVYALNAATGELRWKHVGDEHPSARVTGGIQVFEGRAYVPMASLEEAFAMDANYLCCVFRGSVSAYDIESGERLWKQYTIEQEPTLPSTASDGKAMVGPSGASVWSAVTIDPQRRMIYAGTGDNYSNPPTDSSDSIVAFDLDTGARRWAYQGLSGDAWNVGCMAVPKINCPEGAGPDEDMGASPILVAPAGARPVLLATQKSGVVHAIDPLDAGALLWRKKLAQGGIQGGFQWGQATNGKVLFGSKSDTRWLSDSSISADARFDPDAGGGLVAVDILTGGVLWEAPPVDCSGRQNCSPSQSAAVSVIGDAVFAASQSGEMRAFNAATGAEIWRYDTVRDFDTVNGARGRGGAIDQSGPVAVNGMLYFLSGYAKFSGIPGNVLLAFELPDE